MNTDDDTAEYSMPDTVTEAVALLQADGYSADVSLDGIAATCGACSATSGLDGLVVDHTYRFEGPSDPADEAIVLGVRCPSCGTKGIVVSAFGPEADPEQTELHTRLAHR